MKKIAVAVLLCTQLSISDATTIVFNGCFNTQHRYLTFVSGGGINQIEQIKIDEKKLTKYLRENKKTFEVITLEIPGEFYHKDKRHPQGEWVQTFVGHEAFAGLNSECLKLKLKFTLSRNNYPVKIDDFYRLFCRSSSIIEIDISGAVPTFKIEDASEMCLGCTNLEKMTFGACEIPSNAKCKDMFVGCDVLKEQDDFEVITKKMIANKNAVVQDW